MTEIPGLPGESIYIGQGEHAVGRGIGTVISTLLGSCVAVCVWDPVAQIGGMNHFLLPDGRDGVNGQSSFGLNSMELLLNALSRQGGLRSRFQAKVFGGAEMISGLSDAGSRNGRFAMEYLERENIPCKSSSLGGRMGRRVEFWPADGRARLKFLDDVPLPRFDLPPAIPPQDVELF